ncbi:MAG TPA: hypothetical protein VFE33_23045 [Thermoanaerobaculia bacterium]|nr:hypothetical protein [Thermoanaerobaculia bacterium]
MRKTLLTLLALALFAALPTLAAPAPSAQPAVAPPVAAPVTAACKLETARPFPALATAAPAEPEWMVLGGTSAHKIRGFCRCGCSATPDCRTDADCGGAVGSCSQFISCC